MKPLCACTKCAAVRREEFTGRYVRLVARWRRAPLSLIPASVYRGASDLPTFVRAAGSR